MTTQTKPATAKKLYVRKKHIAKGKPGSNTQCPIALAAKDHFKKSRGVSVGGMIRVGRDWYDMTRRGYLFMDNFDNGRPVKPFSMELKPA